MKHGLLVRDMQEAWKRRFFDLCSRMNETRLSFLRLINHKILMSCDFESTLPIN